MGVFWDLGTCRPILSSDITRTLADIGEQIAPPCAIRTYGDTWGQFKEDCIKAGAEPIESPDMRVIDRLLFDIPLLSGSLTHILLISEQVPFLSDYLGQLKSSLKNTEILVAT